MLVISLALGLVLVCCFQIGIILDVGPSLRVIAKYAVRLIGAIPLAPILLVIVASLLVVKTAVGCMFVARYVKRSLKNSVKY